MTDFTPTDIPEFGRARSDVLDTNFNAIQTAVNSKADKASPALTGAPTAPTAPAGTNTTQIANTAHVFAERSNTATLTNKTITAPIGIVKADVGLSNVDNTADANKPVSTATQAALNLKAPIESPALTGVPTAPTPAVGTATNQLSNCAFVAATAFSAALPAQTGNAGKFVTTNGTVASWADAGINQVAYDSRANLRSMTPANGNLILVEAIGLFRWWLGSTEPDDDETCFVTASGAWLLECPHWDVLDAMQYPDESAQDDRAENSVLYGSAACAITSVATVTQVSFTGTVAGAAVGDRVLATPPNALEPRIACFAMVSAADTVTIYLNNPSASAATLATGTWKLAVFKEI